MKCPECKFLLKLDKRIIKAPDNSRKPVIEHGDFFSKTFMTSFYLLIEQSFYLCPICDYEKVVKSKFTGRKYSYGQEIYGSDGPFG